MKFADLRLCEPVLRALSAENYVTPTPIQAQAIPPALEGRDVLGCAQTGTGKTAAFAVPILHRLSSAPAQHAGNGEQARRLHVGTGPKSNAARCLVLCPTRELATQIGDSFRVYGKYLALGHTTIFGGVGQKPQVDALRRGVEIIVATPGRLLDLMNQGYVNLSAIEVLVLDEADRMLDMGFIHDIRRVCAKLPTKRQTLLFSATMPPEIRQLANSLLTNPATVQVAAAAKTTELIDESVYHVAKMNKPALLAHLVNELPMSRAIVFTRTKRGADRVVRQLHTRKIRAEAIHGNKSQNARQRALDNFRSGKTPVLVATDVASRGIDIDMVSHVVNYDLSHEPETYVHRIGRTGRAGATGAAVSFCDPDEKQWLKAIERLIGRAVPVKHDQPVYAASEVEVETPQGQPRRGPASPRHEVRTGHPHHAPRHQPRSGPAGHAPRHETRSAPSHHAPRHETRSAPTHHAPRQDSRQAPSHSAPRQEGRSGNAHPGAPRHRIRTPRQDASHPQANAHSAHRRPASPQPSNGHRRHPQHGGKAPVGRGASKRPQGHGGRGR